MFVNSYLRKINFYCSNNILDYIILMLYYSPFRLLIITQISHESIVPNIHLSSLIACATSGTFSINHINLNTLKYGFIVKPHLNCKCLSNNLQKNISKY